ncbi:MAG TPA: GNAT family N-acetyltransferase [Candidatus Atribacteria bacterium]|nr:GNAT family N-acetyltransferase [Candidatus Atribacteria bacterium]
MAVKENYQRKGIAKQLFETLVSEFHTKGIKQFRIVVGSSLFKAKKFYQKMGCVKIAEFELHKGEKSEIYVFRR